MRVLHISSYFPYSHSIWGGAEMACKNVVDLLQENGIASAIAVSPVEKDTTLPYRFFSVPRLSDRLPAPYFWFLRQYWLQKDSYVEKELNNVLHIYQPDVVHVHNFSTMTFSALQAVQSSGTPIVLSIYDYWLFCPTDMLVDIHTQPCIEGHGAHCYYRCLKSHFFKKSHYFLNLPIVTRKYYFARQLDKVDRFITLSENSRGILKNHGISEEKIEVVPLPVTIKAKTLDSPIEESGESAESIVLFAGWVQARKGPDLIVKAMSYITEKIAGAKLFVVGPLSESKFEAYIRKLVDDLGLSHCVTFTGKLPQDEFDAIFKRTQVIAIAEQWENMSPVFVLEAMAAGKAIVAGAIGGLPEFIDDGQTGLLAVYNDPMDYANKIIRLLSDKSLRRAFGQNAKNKVQKLCNRQIVFDRLMRAYQNAIGWKYS
jgi:glycosyltransferase involved in cell wall biosynthesis